MGLQYPSASQVAVFIGQYHVDDAYTINYEVQHPRIPLYGYNQKLWSVVADGKVMVTGQLVINYRQPNYLAHAIRKAHEERLKPSVTKTLGTRMDRPQLLRLLDHLRSTDRADERLGMLMDAVISGSLDEMSELLRASFLDDQAGPIGNPVLLPPAEATFDIQIAYDTVSSFMRVEILRNCLLTGLGKAISGSAHGDGGSVSGAPILEVYPFIAQTVETKTINLALLNNEVYNRDRPRDPIMQAAVVPHPDIGVATDEPAIHRVDFGDRYSPAIPLE